MRKIDEAYEYIKNYIAENDCSPTIREICSAINVSSTSTVAYYLKRLAEDKKIVKSAFRNRAIKIVDNPEIDGNAHSIVLPIVTGLTEGLPLFAKQNIADRILVSASLFKGFDMFMMEIPDESMINSGILKGDYVVISRQNVARNGEVVAAIVNGEVVFGKLFKEFQYFKLEPQNRGFTPIYATRIAILGKIIGVIRKTVM